MFDLIASFHVQKQSENSCNTVEELGNSFDDIMSLKWKIGDQTSSNINGFLIHNDNLKSNGAKQNRITNRHNIRNR
jgi:hypothetical protein